MEDYFSEITKFYNQAPIKVKENFFGRKVEQSKLYKSLLSPGRQSCVYGERGVGKTSLVYIVTNYFCKKQNFVSIRHQCSEYDTFEKIFSTLFKETEQDKYLYEEKEKGNSQLGAKIKIPIVEIGGDLASEIEKSYKSISTFEINPQSISSAFMNKTAVFLIDEFDRIQNKNVQRLIAETIKALSDSGSKLKLIISGIAHNTSALIGEHPSIIRHLKPIKVGRMPDVDLERIINHGEKSLNLNFDNNVKNLIIYLSNGLPYFTHLISEQLADNAFYKRDFNIDIENLKENISNILDHEIFQVSKEIVLSSVEIMHETYENLSGIAQEMLLIQEKRKREENYTRKVIIYSCAFIKELSNETMLSFINYLKSIKSNLKLDAIDEATIILSLEEISASSNILVQLEDSYYFKDSFVKTFTFLMAIEFFNKNKVPNSVYKSLGGYS